MPERFLRATLTLLLKAFFRVEVRGREHFKAAGERVVIIANHQSFLDPLLLATFLPEKPAFAMNSFMARKRWLRPFLKKVTIYPIDPTQPISTKSVIAALKRPGGAKVVIFPEGRITTTGGIMKMYDGTGLILEKTGAKILSVHIDGAAQSRFSLMGCKMRRRWFPRITLTFFPPVAMPVPAGASARERRRASAQWLYDTMTHHAFLARFSPRPLLRELALSGRRYGMGMKIAEDTGRSAVTYRGLLVRSFALALALAPKLLGQKHVGILLPTSLAGLVAFLALHRLGSVPAMLNFSAGERNLRLACQMAEVRTILTSRAFVARGKLQPLLAALAPDAQILYLEDVRKDVTNKDRRAAFLRALRPLRALDRLGQHAYDTAVILFTSGSEGAPKGVALSHANLIANSYQAAARISFTNQDVMLNALPIFHSFGLSIGTLLPLLLGIRVFLYPSPLHYRVIPEIAYDINATILLGSDTFFKGYAAYAHDYDFQSLRLAVAGAEKLKDDTRALWARRFRVNILEGYGVTEASPAIAFNTPLEHKAGTVGRPFPGMECAVAPVEGLAAGGRLFVSGPNVMIGYIHPDRPGTVGPHGKWYDTGDVVEVDGEGYIRIVGRAKRFAKVGGEMVSLTAVEELAARHWPEAAHAALAVADMRKGEQIVLITEAPDLECGALVFAAQDAGLPEIALPRRVLFLESLPRLGSGKIDYMELKRMIAPYESEM